MNPTNLASRLFDILQRQAFLDLGYWEAQARRC